jgi:hypothetical protein
MVQVIDQQEGLGGSLGGLLGKGIGGGLQILLNQKLQDIQEQKSMQKQKAQKALLEKHYEDLGMPKGLAHLDSSVQKEILKREANKNLFNQIFGGQQPSGLDNLDITERTPQGEVEEDETHISDTSQKQPYSDQQIFASSLVNPNLARVMQSQNESILKRQERKEDIALKKSEVQEKRSFERNKKFLEKSDEERQALPRKRLALKRMEKAIKSNDFSSIRNSVADYLGFDMLKSASAQEVTTAVKEFLLSDVQALQGRPNQFIEKLMSKSYINPQYSKEANNAIYQGLADLSQLKEKELDIVADLEEEFTNKGKEIPRNFQQLVKKRLQPDIDAFEKKLEDSLKEIDKKAQKLPENTVRMMDPDGNIRAVPKDKAKAAQDAGYKLQK